MNIVIIAVAVISFIVFRIFYFLGLPTAEVIAKGISSEVFLFYAFYNYYKNTEKSPAFRRYGIKMICGLSVAVIADITINLNIPAGITLFLIMQIFYILAYLEFKSFSIKNLCLTVVMSIVFLAGDQLSPFFHLGTLFLPIAIYTFFLAGATLKALDAILLPNKRARIVPVAALLFLAADFVLQFTLGDICNLSFVSDQIVSNITHLLYYSAQFLFACSLSKDFIAE